MNINADSNKTMNGRICVDKVFGTLQISCVLDSFHKETNTIIVYMTKFNIMELNYYTKNKLDCKIYPNLADYSDDDILDKFKQLKVSEKKDGNEYNNNNDNTNIIDNDNDLNDDDNKDDDNESSNSVNSAATDLSTKLRTIIKNKMESIITTNISTGNESTNTSEAEFNKFNGRDFGEALQYFNVSSKINIQKTELGWTIKDEYFTHDLPKYSLINITYKVDQYSRHYEYLIVNIAPITWIGVVKDVNKQNHAWIGTDASIEAWTHDSKIILLKIYYDNKLKKPEYRIMDLPEYLVVKEEMNVSFHLKLSTETVNNTEPVNIVCYNVKDTDNYDALCSLYGKSYVDNQYEYDLKNDLLHTRYVWDEAKGEYRVISSDNNNE